MPQAVATLKDSVVAKFPFRYKNYNESKIALRPFSEGGREGRDGEGKNAPA